MNQKHHYTGLTDAQVLESRQKYGVNVLTPPEMKFLSVEANRVEEK